MNPDDTTHCPTKPRCECCPAAEGLLVLPAHTDFGIFCVTICQSCVADGPLPDYTPPAIRRRVAEHADHLGETADQLPTSPR